MSETVAKPPIEWAEGEVNTPEKIIQDALALMQSLFDNMHEGRRDIEDKGGRFPLSVNAQCEAFGVVVLMETLRRIDPEVASRAAAVLWECWDDGGLPGEHVWCWRRERAEGKEIDQGGYVFPRILDSRVSS